MALMRTGKPVFNGIETNSVSAMTKTCLFFRPLEIRNLGPVFHHDNQAHRELPHLKQVIEINSREMDVHTDHYILGLASDFSAA
jgi:hypothetical protein